MKFKDNVFFFQAEDGIRDATVTGVQTCALPPGDSLDLLAHIYELDPPTYRERLRKLVDQFEIGPLLDVPVRKLSLGERMRCEIVGSLLHRPAIVFLDEPTIGLDV